MNLKNSFLIVSVLFLAIKLNAQDTLFKTNGSKIVVKIMEISNSEIKYKMLGSNSDLVVSENKNNVHHISYSNGLKEFYNTSATVNPINDPGAMSNVASKEVFTYAIPEEKKYGKNVIAVNFFETIFTNFGFSYERIFKDGYLSVKIPVSFGLGGRPNQNMYDASQAFNMNMDYLTNKIFGTGVEINAYPVKFKRSAFYVGITGEYGQFHYYSYSNQTYPYYAQIIEGHVGNHYAGMFHVGGNIGLTDQILIGAKIGMGYKYQETIFQDYTRFKMDLDLNLAYRF